MMELILTALGGRRLLALAAASRAERSIGLRVARRRDHLHGRRRRGQLHAQLGQLPTWEGRQGSLPAAVGHHNIQLQAILEEASIGLVLWRSLTGQEQGRVLNSS